MTILSIIQLVIKLAGTIIQVIKHFNQKKIMETIFRNKRTYVQKFEVNEQPSKVVPGKALAISELLKRRAAGMPTTETLNPVYNPLSDMNGVDLEKFRDLDHYEKQQITKSLVQEHQQKLKNIEALKKLPDIENDDEIDSEKPE